MGYLFGRFISSNRGNICFDGRVDQFRNTNTGFLSPLFHIVHPFHGEIKVIVLLIPRVFGDVLGSLDFHIDNYKGFNQGKVCRKICRKVWGESADKLSRTLIAVRMWRPI